MSVKNATNGGAMKGASHTVNRLRYIPCKAEPGMFKGEYLVRISGFNPSDHTKVEAQLFADEQEIAGLDPADKPRRNKSSHAYLLVTFVSEEDDLADVILPQPAQPVGERILVRSDQLKEKVG